MMSIMILATTSLLSFSIGTLVLRELKSSRQFSQSEPAYGSAEAGAETGLFFHIRKLDEYNEICPSTDSGTLSSGSGFEICSNLYDDPFYFNTTTDNVKAILLFNPLDQSDPAAGYSQISITATSGTAVVLTASAYNLDDPEEEAITVSVGVGGGPSTLSGLDPNKSYAVFLDPGGISLSANGSVTGITGGGATGIPSETPTLESTGNKNNLLRKLRVKLW